MSKSIYLFCEGSTNSPDIAILQSIPFNNPVIIQPLGGKGGYKRFAEGFLVQPKSLGTSFDYFVLRDRDFDHPVPERAELWIEERNKAHLTTHRITIENYLLTPEHFWNFLTSRNTPNIPETIKNLYPTLDSVRILFREAARTIAYFQAARHALGAIRVIADQKTNFIKSNNTGKVQFHDSGTLPEQLDRAACNNAAHKVINWYHDEISGYTTEQFDVRYEQFVRQFTTPEFLETDQHLICFNGKDIQKALTQINSDLSSFPFSTFYRYTLENFDYSKFPDFVQLKAIIDRVQ